jgi:hypothetical protein
MRLVGEEILQEDPLKTSLYPRASRTLVTLMDGYLEHEHTRQHLVSPTVMLVAAAEQFNATLDRPRGVALLRRLADVLEHQRLADIPWGPKNDAHRPAFRELIDAEMKARRPPEVDYEDGANGMLSLMRLLETEFGEGVDRLVDRFQDMAEGADPALLYGFLVHFLFRRYAQFEEAETAALTVRSAAVDQGWTQPG